MSLTLRFAYSVWVDAFGRCIDAEKCPDHSRCMVRDGNEVGT